MAAINHQYPNALAHQSLPKIINQQEFDRVIRIIEKYRAQIIYGGQYHPETLMIEPTIIEVPPEVIKECGEIFGPVILISPINGTIDEFIKTINKIDKSPLAAYIFSNDVSLQKRFTNEVVAGGYCVNDALIHLTNHHLPFGGEYTSGFGKYHGKYSFDAFSLVNAKVINNAKKDLPIKYINNKYDYKKTKSFINFIKRFFH